MNLEQVMARAAEQFAGDGDELTVRVREWLLQALAGQIQADPPLADWLALWRARPGDPAGDLYQELLRRRVSRGSDGPVITQERAGHRRTGAYYSTTPVVTYMAQRAKALLPGARSLIDPACGAGALLAAAAERFGPELDLDGWDQDPVGLALCRQRLPGATLVQQDALFSPQGGSYDLCLGNPPYISSGLRGAVAHDPERLVQLRRRYPQSAQYKLNTYPLFIERGLELLRPGGLLGYIVPDSFLTGRYFAGVRQLLLRHTIEEITLIRQDFWSHSRVGQSVILFVRKAPPPPGHQTLVRLVDSPDGPGAEALVDRTDLIWGELHRFRLVTGATERARLRQMESQGRPLGYWLTSYSGLIGRQGQASLVLAPGERYAGPQGRLLRSGAEIDRYRLDWGGGRVRLDPALIKSGGNRAYYEGPKLLLRQTADALRAVYDDQGLFCLNNIHLLVPARPQVNLLALLAVINSALAGQWYRGVAMEAGRLYAQVDLDLLSALPVPDLDPPVLDRLAALAAARLAAPLAVAGPATNEEAAPEGAASCEAAIDHLVATAYGLLE